MMKFFKGDRIRVKVDVPSEFAFLTKAPAGTVQGVLHGDGLDVYLIELDNKKRSVEFVDPENPHFELAV
jgi:hypothetical protein